MKRDGRAFTLVELMVVIAVVGLLLVIVLPSLASARNAATLAVCSANMHDCHIALMQYAATYENRLPPFAFSDTGGNLPLSGNWGGYGPGNGAIGRANMDYVNLWALVRESITQQGVFTCPGAPSELRSGKASLFADTRQFSTYCLRMPYSPELFTSSPHLAGYGGGNILSVYRMKAGGQAMHVAGPVGQGANMETIPQVRLDWTYTSAADGGTYAPLTGAMLADGFWQQDSTASGGAVRVADDDGIVRAATTPPGGSLADDSVGFATYAETVWGFFDAKFPAAGH